MYQKLTIVGDGILTHQGLDGILALSTVAGNRVSRFLARRPRLIQPKQSQRCWFVLGV